MAGLLAAPRPLSIPPTVLLVARRPDRGIEAVASAAEPPNVVLMLADDMGLGDTSAHWDFTGNPPEVQIHTPTMERLANSTRKMLPGPSSRRGP